MNMGQKIHSLRTQKGLTLEELGDMVGVGKSTVRKWENGMIANMKRDKILKVSEALETTPAYLMGWNEKNNTSSHPENEHDIEKILDQICKQLLYQDDLMFGNIPASPEAIKSILTAIQIGVEIAKKKSMEEYNLDKCKRG